MSRLKPDPEYRREQTEKADDFVRWYVARLRAAGHDVIIFETLQEQLTRGDICVDGTDIEVKFDQRLAERGKLYIEIDELTRDGARYVRSGIYAKAKWQWLLIGDREEFYLFHRPVLIAEHERLVRLGRKMATAKGGLGHGFFVTRKLALELCSSSKVTDRRKRTW